MKCLVILFSIILMACANNAAQIPVKDSTYGIQTYPDTAGYRIFVTNGKLSRDSSRNEVLRRENDSLRTALFQAQFKVNKVRYYLKICLRNPSQDKFLKGWVKRAIQ